MGVSELISEILALKAKIKGVFLMGYCVAIVTPNGKKL